MKKLNWNLISKYRNQLFGIAILSVMIFHYTMDVNKFINPARFLSKALYWYDSYISAVGVEMFAALSGMGLYYSFSKDNNIKSFYFRRIRRLLIPYIIVAVPFWYIRDIYILHRGYRRMIKDFCFITFFTDGVTTFWYIFFSIVMYLIFPFIYYLLKMKCMRWINFFALIFVSCSLCGIVYYANETLYWNIYLAVVRIPVFIFGCFVGKYIKEGKSSPYIVWIILSVCGFLGRHLLYKRAMPNFLWQYLLWILMLGVIPFLVLILEILKNYQWIHKILGIVGQHSLELYMIHIIVRNLHNTLKLTMNKLSIVWLFLLISVFVLSGWLAQLTAWINEKIVEQIDKKV